MEAKKSINCGRLLCVHVFKPGYKYTILCGHGVGQESIFPPKESHNAQMRDEINQLRSNGKEPVISFIAKDIDEELAFLCEAMAIEKHGMRKDGGILCNIMGGHKRASGMRNSYSKLVEDMTVEERIAIGKIPTRIKDMTPDERREYDREHRARNRAKKKAQATTTNTQP